MATSVTRQANLLQVENAKVGSPQLLGTITATSTSQDNSTTAVPFVIPAGTLLLLQGDAEFSYAPEAAAATTIVATAAVTVASKARELVWLQSSEAYVAVVASTGTVNVKVFALV